jgi:hypothetical protein
MKLLTLTATLALLLFRSDNAVAQVGDAVEGGLSQNGSGDFCFENIDSHSPLSNSNDDSRTILTMSAPSRPRDGPATSFEADPKVSSLFSKEDDYFGLVLVAGWPPNPDVMDPPYSSLLDYIRSCFLDSDVVSGDGDPPNVYLYPSKYLHVTVATLYPVEKRKEGVDYDQLQSAYSFLVHAASQRPEWPTAPLQLQIESMQLGSKAGILLWKEVASGTCIQQMRRCLEQEARLQTMTIHSIPGIVHSTFLRFHKHIPAGEGIHIQERFQSLVVPRIQELFGDDDDPIVIIEARTVKLVCETTPYMHIPDDDDHVVVTISLEKK